MGANLERFKAGNFNTCNQKINDDGSKIITMTVNGDSHTYITTVTGLYTPDETVISEETK